MLVINFIININYYKYYTYRNNNVYTFMTSIRLITLFIINLNKSHILK